MVTSKAEDVTVEFYNMLGQRVYNLEQQLIPGINKINFDLHRFSAGTYSAVIASDNITNTKKVVVVGNK